MPPINYTVGQVVCIVITLNVKKTVPLKAEVIKVGRKWVNLRTIGVYPAPFKVKVGSRDIDGGNYSSPGKVWVDEREYQCRKKTEETWSVLQRRIACTEAPDHISEEDVRFAASRLGLPL
jgi:hypothetical protein